MATSEQTVTFRVGETTYGAVAYNVTNPFGYRYWVPACFDA